MSVANPAVLRAGASPDRRSPLAAWHVASRLARREVRRRRGRTLLVMLLVALPVFSMVIYDVLSRTSHDSHQEQYRRRFGDSDLAVDGVGMRMVKATGRSEPTDVGALTALLPAGSRVVEVHSLYWAPVRAAGAIENVRVRFTDLPLGDPMLAETVDVSEGRVPSAPDEALLHPQVAQDLGVQVGDTLVLELPEATYRVVGIGRARASFDEPLMVVGAYDFASLRADSVQTGWLADLPGGSAPVEANTLDAVAQLGGLVDTPFGSPVYEEDNLQTEQLAWGWIGGVVALMVMGIVITAAFATSARRQLVTLGQLSANGASQALMRRTLALQGAWSGLFGSLLGIAVALVALTVGRSWFESTFTGHDMGGLVIGVADLLVIAATGTIAATVAAFIPARSISRVPVLSALAGRRPLGRVPRRLVPTGLALFSAGVFLLLLVATMSGNETDSSNANLYAFTAVVGGVCVLFGMCCVTPAVVALLGPVGEALGGAGRVAARSLARSRTRTAAVVTAVAATAALAMAAGTGVASSDTTPEWEELIRRDTVVVNSDGWVEDLVAPSRPPVGELGVVDGEGEGDGVVEVVEPMMRRLPTTLPDDVRTAIATALPDAAITPLRFALVGEDRYLVADDAVVTALGLTAAEVEAVTSGRARDMEWTGDLLTGEPLITEKQALERGATITTAGLFVDSPHDLTASERDALDAISERFSNDWNPFVPATVSQGEREYIWLNYWGPQGWRPSHALIQAIIVGVALILTMIVVAIGIALAATESRDERDVLVAVGAPPWSMRRVAALKAVLVACLGGLLAIPTGFIPVAVVMAEAGDDPVKFPWLTALGVAVVVPLVIGVIAFVCSAVAQRVRPVRMSRLTVD